MISTLDSKSLNRCPNCLQKMHYSFYGSRGGDGVCKHCKTSYVNKYIKYKNKYKQSKLILSGGTSDYMSKDYQYMELIIGLLTYMYSELFKEYISKYRATMEEQFQHYKKLDDSIKFHKNPNFGIKDEKDNEISLTDATLMQIVYHFIKAISKNCKDTLWEKFFTTTKELSTPALYYDSSFRLRRLYCNFFHEMAYFNTKPMCRLVNVTAF